MKTEFDQHFLAVGGVGRFCNGDTTFDCFFYGFEMHFGWMVMGNN